MSSYFCVEWTQILHALSRTFSLFLPLFCAEDLILILVLIEDEQDLRRMDGMNVCLCFLFSLSVRMMTGISPWSDGWWASIVYCLRMMPSTSQSLISALKGIGWRICLWMLIFRIAVVLWCLYSLSMPMVLSLFGYAMMSSLECRVSSYLLLLVCSFLWILNGVGTVVISALCSWYPFSATTFFEFKSCPRRCCWHVHPYILMMTAWFWYTGIRIICMSSTLQGYPFEFGLEFRVNDKKVQVHFTEAI